MDVGVRAFMPASRSGARDAAEMEKLVGQEIPCRIIKLDVADEDVVVDRRAVLEEEERADKEKRYSEVKEGETVQGTVRSLTDYGAFVDIGGVDALLHVADISWGRVNKPADVLTGGQTRSRCGSSRWIPPRSAISLGLKQLSRIRGTWLARSTRSASGCSGTVTRVTDFGAFVELEQGIEGLIHLSEMSWSKKVRKPSDVVKPGDTVEVVMLGVNRGGPPHFAGPQAGAGRSVGGCRRRSSRWARWWRARSPASRSSARSCSWPKAWRA